MCEVDGVVVVITWANRQALIISCMLRPEWKCGMNREEKRRVFRNPTLAACQSHVATCLCFESNKSADNVKPPNNSIRLGRPQEETSIGATLTDVVRSSEREVGLLVPVFDKVER